MNLRLIAALSIIVAVPAIGQRARTRIVVGPNVTVSRQNPQLDHTEFLVAQDPANSRRLLACIMLWSSERNRLATGIYGSFDGGNSWRMLFNDTSSYEVWDPACAFGGNGEMLFSTIPFGEASRDSDATVIYRSTDAGKTWSKPFRLSFEDRQYFTVDRTGKKYDGRIYLHVNGGVQDTSGRSLRREVHLYYSTDNGQTFIGPIVPPESDSFTYQLTIPGQGTVLDDGTLLIPYWTMHQPKDGKGPSVSHLEVFSTTDGGAHVEPGIVVGKMTSCGDITLPTISVDRSRGPFAGRVYLAWGERRAGRCRILLASSSDNGKHWTSPILVDDTRAAEDTLNGPDAFLPAMTVNKDGIVGVMWYDRREDVKNRGHRLRFAASIDGGQTMTRSVPVSTAAYTYPRPERIPTTATIQGGGSRRARRPTESLSTNVIYGPRLYDGVGDTDGMTSGNDGRFHLFWVDNRTRISQLYTAPVTVIGRVTKNGAPELDSLENITKKLEARYTRVVYDGSSHTVSLDVTLRNTSTDTVRGPLKLRATKLESNVGDVVASNADNGELGPGAIWDLTAQMPKRRALLPGETTRARRLVFTLNRAAPPLGRRRNNLMGFDAVIFGGRGKAIPKPGSAAN
jgi:hypothetical protein